MRPTISDCPYYCRDRGARGELQSARATGIIVGGKGIKILVVKSVASFSPLLISLAGSMRLEKDLPRVAR